MNRAGLAFNIFITVLVLMLSCNKPTTIKLTGIYKAQVKLHYVADDTVVYDTTFNTILVVNDFYGLSKSYQLQWNFDNYVIIDNKRIFVPNIFNVTMEQNIFLRNPKIVFKLTSNPGVEHFQGYYAQDSIVVEFYYPQSGLQVSIRSVNDE